MNLNFSEVKTDYSREDILRKLSEENILEYYFGQQLSFKDKMYSPFRKENRPSFSFKKDTNIIWKDWGTGEAGDCFKFVMKKYGCTYHEALRIIVNDLLKGKVDRVDNNILTELQIMKEEYNKSTKKYTQIHTVNKNFCITDFNFWNKYNISLPILTRFNVCSVAEVWLSRYNYPNREYDAYKRIKEYSNSNPSYCYTFQTKEREIKKIYSPCADREYKFISNEDKDTIEGYEQLPKKGKLLILTKALKDTMSLYSIGYTACNFQSEAFMPSSSALNELKDRFERVVVMYDNDTCGIEFAHKISEKHKIDSISIPLIDYEAKDISDLIKVYGIAEATKLMDILL